MVYYFNINGNTSSAIEADAIRIPNSNSDTMLDVLCWGHETGSGLASPNSGTIHVKPNCKRFISYILSTSSKYYN